MLTIGEFSQAAKITVKALRHYHEMGLLAPELVDEETGYRYYGWKSFERARAISALKEIDAGIRQQRAIQKKIRVFLSEIENMGDEQKAGLEVGEEEVPETLLFGLRHQGRYQEIGHLISLVYRTAGRHAASFPGERPWRWSTWDRTRSWAPATGSSTIPCEERERMCGFPSERCT